MLEVPESHVTLGVYSSKRGIGVPKKEKEPFPVWLIVVLVVMGILFIAIVAYLFTRKRTDATSSASSAASSFASSNAFV
jgi:hypothetical protein